MKKSGKNSAEEKMAKSWSVPSIKSDFDLEAALQNAVKKAADYMNGVLNLDDMMIEMQQVGDKTVGVVSDSFNGKTVSQYERNQVLKLYAVNKKPLGAIIDGRV